MPTSNVKIGPLGWAIFATLFEYRSFETFNELLAVTDRVRGEPAALVETDRLLEAGFVEWIALRQLVASGQLRAGLWGDLAREVLLLTAAGKAFGLKHNLKRKLLPGFERGGSRVFLV